MFCDKCGKEIPDDIVSCPFCGKDQNINLAKSPYRKVTVKEAFANFFKYGFDANGVACKKEYIVMIIFQVVYSLIFGIFYNPISTTINIILFFPYMALAIRRYHDVNMSGAYSVLYGYALVGYLFSFCDFDLWIRLLLLSTAAICLFIHLLFMLKDTNPNSRWNPVNGYM